MPYLLLILTTLFWSGNFVVSRGMHGEIPPFALSFWRWLVAFLLFACFGMPHLWRQRAVLKRHARYITVQGLLGVTGFNSLVYLAVQTTTAINAVLVNSCIPVLIAVCSWILYREIMSVRQCIGVFLSLFGVLLIIARGDVGFVTDFSLNRGDLLMLLAAMTWALYSANLKRFPAGLHPFSYLSAIMIVGLIGISPFYLIEMFLGRTLTFTPETAAAVFYVALFASVLAFIFWNSAVRRVGANKAGPFIHLMPVFSTVLAILFLGETVSSYHLYGIVLIFTGITLTTYKTAKK